MVVVVLILVVLAVVFLVSGGGGLELTFTRKGTPLILLISLFSFFL